MSCPLPAAGVLLPSGRCCQRTICKEGAARARADPTQLRTRSDPLLTKAIFAATSHPSPAQAAHSLSPALKEPLLCLSWSLKVLKGRLWMLREVPVPQRGRGGHSTHHTGAHQKAFQLSFFLPPSTGRGSQRGPFALSPTPSPSHVLRRGVQSLHCPCWAQTRDPHASASRVLRLQTCIATASSHWLLT